MDTELIVWFIVVMWFVSGIANIICGMAETEKPTEYGKGHIITGLILVIVACYFLFGG